MTTKRRITLSEGRREHDRDGSAVGTRASGDIRRAPVSDVREFGNSGAPVTSPRTNGAVFAVDRDRHPKTRAASDAEALRPSADGGHFPIGGAKAERPHDVVSSQNTSEGTAPTARASFHCRNAPPVGFLPAPAMTTTCNGGRRGRGEIPGRATTRRLPRRRRRMPDLRPGSALIFVFISSMPSDEGALRGASQRCRDPRNVGKHVIRIND